MTMTMMNDSQEVDEEQLIRIFVQLRLRREPKDGPTDHAIEIDLSLCIYDRTQYKLPVTKKEMNDAALKTIFTDLTAVAKASKEATNKADKSMQVIYKVIAPMRIVYYDLRTGSELTYGEYESRYNLYLKSTKDVKQAASFSENKRARCPDVIWEGRQNKSSQRRLSCSIVTTNTCLETQADYI
jgi:hypothetical protein